MSEHVALVTGTLTVIGRATATAFGRDGASVLVSGRHDEKARRFPPSRERGAGLLGLCVRGLVTDGRQEGAVWLPVETGSHQVGHVHDGQSPLQTPAQKVGVAHRH